MRGFYCELWINSHTYYARERGDVLKRQAKAIGAQRPNQDYLDRFTWKNPKDWVKPSPRRW